MATIEDAGSVVALHADAEEFGELCTVERIGAVVRRRAVVVAFELIRDGGESAGTLFEEGPATSVVSRTKGFSVP
jgi:hypothetical protein